MFVRTVIFVVVQATMGLVAEREVLRRLRAFIGFNTTLDVTRRDGTIDTRLDIFKRCQHK